VVGSKDEGAKLAKYAVDGKVNYFDSYGAPVKATETAVVPAGITADVVMKNYIKAIGGEKAINSIKDIKTVMTGELQGGMPITITEMRRAPNMFKEAVVVTVQGQTIPAQTEVYNGVKGYQESRGQRADLTADDLEEIKPEADIYADLHPEMYGIKRKVTGVENIKGSDAYVVEATNVKGKVTTEYYDVKSGLLVRKVETQQGEQGPVSQISDYSDYKEVPGGNGYKLHYTVTENNITATVQSVDINKGIPDSEFN